MPATLSRGQARRLPHLLLVLLLTLAAFAGLAGRAPSASAATAGPAGSAIRYALAQLGDPYVWGATGPSSFDCSGFTSSAYRAAGITIPRTSKAQYGFGPKIAKASWKPGDLIFFAGNTGDPSTIHHVAIYLGSNMMLDAPHTGTVVQVRPVYTSGLMPYGTRPAGLSATGLLPVAPGTSGDAVRDVQTRLRANGLAVTQTGVFDAATVRAVKSFQAAHALAADGYVGSGTWGKLVALGTRTRVS